ncbi:hypothetical protein EYY95_11655 [Hafnia alvei]|nr:hypothetical protein EYY95_11655 [Hafnia alvei]
MSALNILVGPWSQLPMSVLNIQVGPWSQSSVSTLNIQVCLSQLPGVVIESLGRNVQESGEWIWNDVADSFSST